MNAAISKRAACLRCMSVYTKRSACMTRDRCYKSVFSCCWKERGHQEDGVYECTPPLLRFSISAPLSLHFTTPNPCFSCISVYRERSPCRDRSERTTSPPPQKKEAPRGWRVKGERVSVERVYKQRKERSERSTSARHQSLRVRQWQGGCCQR